MITNAAPEFENFTIDEYKNALMLASSRMFPLEINKTSTSGMVPFADMINHGDNKSVYYNYNNTLNGFTMRSKRDIQKGETLYAYYGKNSNQRFFLNYGFLLENNSQNQVTFSINIDKNS